MKRARQKKFHFLYKTTCLTTGGWYIGMHSTDDINDGYLGSGRWILNSIKKHGEKNHHRDIIEFCDSREILCEREEQTVTLELIEDHFCMNLIKGGSSNHFPVGQDTRDRMRLAKLGKKQSATHIAARSAACLGRIQTVETRDKLRTIAQNQWERRRSGDEMAVGKRDGQLSHKNRIG